MGAILKKGSARNVAHSSLDMVWPAPPARQGEGRTDEADDVGPQGQLSLAGLRKGPASERRPVPDSPGAALEGSH